MCVHVCVHTHYILCVSLAHVCMYIYIYIDRHPRWFKGEIYVNRVMNVEAANRASINVNKKKGSTISVKKRGWLSALLTAKLLAGWPRDDDRM